VKYLVDANVLSEPTKPLPDPRVLAWLHKHQRDIAVAPVILGELRFGILILPQGKKWAALLAGLRATGKATPIKDSLIAAPAAVHGLAVVSRNRADFANAGIPVVDPFVV